MRQLVACCLTLFLVGAAHADDKHAAKQAFVEGSRQYDVGDFQAALTAFKRAYLNYEDPAFLFNIAQCQRVLGDKTEALRTYRIYLQKVPNAPNRVDVERVIADLQAPSGRERAATPATVAVAPPATVAVAPPAAESRPPEAPAHVPSALALTTNSLPARASDRVPVYKKWWLWTVVGAVAAGAALGIGLGVGLQKTNNTTLPAFGPNASRL
jgi:tetratricopeptide (TPR) repeat protein